MQILVPTVHNVQQTVEISQVQFWGWFWSRPLLCNNRCLGWDRAMLRSMWIHVVHHPGWLLEEFHDVLLEGVDSAPEVDSRRFSAHMADEEVAVLVVNSGSGMRSTGFACDAPRVVSDVCLQEVAELVVNSSRGMHSTGYNIQQQHTTSYIHHTYTIHTSYIHHHTTYIHHHTTYIQHTYNIHATCMQHTCNTKIQHTTTTRRLSQACPFLLCLHLS